MLSAWLLFPLVMAALSLGCGLLVDRIAGGRLPGTLLLPLGFGAIVVAADLATATDTTARLAVPAVVALGLAGLGLELVAPLRGRRLDPWAAATALLVFAAYAAPVVLTGEATLAGYIKLDDTATWLALNDQALAHGRDLSGLAPSSHKAILDYYLHHTGYPVGSVVPLGVGARLTGQDPLWAYQPYLAFQGVLLALGLTTILRSFVRSPWLRAAAAVVAAQPALLYGYALWGSVKEVVTAPLLALLAALVVRVVRRPERTLDVVPPAVATAALLAVVNVSGGIWLALSLLPALVLGLRIPLRAFLRRLALFAAVALTLSIPTLATANAFAGPGLKGLTGSSDLGNLFHPLSVLQLAGVWPVGDFRSRPGQIEATYVLVGGVILAAVWGLTAAVRRRHAELVLYTGISLVGWAVIASFGSPWVDAKALAVASPALLLAALAGAAFAFERGRRVEALIVAAAIAGGVLWSNALAWHEVWLAPRDQLAELEVIGNRYEGQGPTLVTEFQVYGTRHLLRRMDPEGVSDRRTRLVPLRGGALVPKGGYADIDEFELKTILVYRTLVLDRSPVASRPPSPYRLVWHGRFYEVWQRPARYFASLAHVPLGNGTQPSAVPSCTDVLTLGRLAARAHGRLATVPRPPATVVDLAELPHPRAWDRKRGALYPRAAGTIETMVSLPAPGRYGIWIGGSYPGRFEASVDGARIGAARHRLEQPGQYVPLGDVELAAGRHRVTLRYGGPDLHPGSGARLTLQDPLGLLVLSRTTAELPVRYVRPSAARSLCGRRLDWIEVVAPARRS